MKNKIILFLIMALMLGCTESVKRLEYEDFDENKLFPLHELYNMRTYRHIDKALATPDAVYKLSLIKNGLVAVPEEVYEFKYLNTLELTMNELNDLPVYIGDMLYLQSLYLTSNKFTMVPEPVYNLKNLKRIRMGGNQLSEIPQQLVMMQSIQELFFGKNMITEIPSATFDMQDLYVLKLNHNKIEHLSPKIAQLEKLEVLNLSSNNISEIPFDALKAMRRLKALDFRNNNMNVEVLDSLQKVMTWAKIYY
ncbi:MAG: hypothetical protein U9R60_02795 [Bacteroidota bacterium]|nr:hypothetical protein [Bacteroidota bacterium]